jgi:hypothetical protein
MFDYGENAEGRQERALPCSDADVCLAMERRCR